MEIPKRLPQSVRALLTVLRSEADEDGAVVGCTLDYLASRAGRATRTVTWAIAYLTDLGVLTRTDNGSGYWHDAPAYQLDLEKVEAWLAARLAKPKPGSAPPFLNPYEVGQHVHHKAFGHGSVTGLTERVVRVTFGADEEPLTLDAETVHRRRLLVLADAGTQSEP